MKCSWNAQSNHLVTVALKVASNVREKSLYRKRKSAREAEERLIIAHAELSTEIIAKP